MIHDANLYAQIKSINIYIYIYIHTYVLGASTFVETYDHTITSVYIRINE